MCQVILKHSNMASGRVDPGVPQDAFSDMGCTVLGGSTYVDTRHTVEGGVGIHQRGKIHALVLSRPSFHGEDLIISSLGDADNEFLP